MGASSSKAIVPSDAVVVITGCDSGFGRMLALQLAGKGLQVLAGCLTSAGQAGLKDDITTRGISEKSLRTFSLDVTSEVDAKKCAELVESLGGKLFALVNNAGIAEGGLVEACPIEAYKRIFEVNTLGPVRMSRHLLPHLRNFSTAHLDLPPPRIIMVSSLAGILAGGGLAAYCASKAALESISDTLRRELVRFSHRVSVSIIEPSYANTPIVTPAHSVTPEQAVEKFKAGTVPELTARVVRDYGGEARIRWKSQKDKEFSLLPAQTVVDVIADHVTRPDPPIRTMVALPRDRRGVALLLRLPDRTVDWLIAELPGRAEAEEFRKAVGGQ
ncbi:NAD(P)-binding protein [Gonapodya prolifera JEL478]|uniref:NAD(P)-binding protein n=1 Tax=Gonapodya prolifera (strain JEL478) TaxID=1344416 RepID=A0A139AB13_GONPJ|nr:NAD(P)-binding protein [Gonapodya prolifera JEL478]|eukprot:KXS13849.1 NAD(P)-binding protein [Gonapodya prolifera JEL478]